MVVPKEPTAIDQLNEAVEFALDHSRIMGSISAPDTESAPLIERIREFVYALEAGEVPDKYPLRTQHIMDRIDPLQFHLSFTLKGILNGYGMWAIVDKEWTKVLADHIGKRHALEIMAGSGWLTKALRGHGVSMSSTDDQSWKHVHQLAKGDGTVEAITNLDALEAVHAFPHAEILIVSWPPYNETFIVDVCDAWGSDRPIIFIGEGSGGCTACNEFFTHYDGQRLDVDMPRHQGIHDYVYCGYWRRTKDVQKE
ncbi:MAG: hypothetical protein GY833_22490 [Aestuariibacter sp.]|nr:hypothetical protein [Aestuariibacter sp.]